MTRPTVSVLTLRPLLQLLEQRGAGVRPLLAAAGLEAASFEDPQSRVPVEQSWQLWRAAVQKTGDEELGLHAASAVQPNSFEVVGYLGMASATLGDALQQIRRYARFMSDLLRLELDAGRDVAVLRFEEPLGVPRPVADFRVALLVRMGRLVTGRHFVPHEVRFEHPSPASIAAYTQAFGCPVRFGCERDSIVFPETVLDVPVLGADPLLCAILERFAENLLEDIDKRRAFRQDVLHTIATHLPRGEVSHDRVAHLLGVSSRTLRRRLREEGTSHRELLDKVRRELAVRYFREEGRTVAEVAALLGFRDPKALHKAFKRWTGTSPKRGAGLL